ncbi:MAG: hypothetical protein AAF634_06715 [Bacteroidota bacterium]
MELDNYIEDLLEKYFEATATIAEEEELKRYFAQEEVALHLAQYKPMFNYFSIAEKEQFTKQVPLNTKKKINYGWISAAAAVVLAFGIYFGPDQYKAYQDKKEAEYAYEETKKALNLLAENFGKGREKVAYLNEFAVAKSKVFNEN